MPSRQIPHTVALALGIFLTRVEGLFRLPRVLVARLKEVVENDLGRNGLHLGTVTFRKVGRTGQADGRLSSDGSIKHTGGEV